MKNWKRLEYKGYRTKIERNVIIFCEPESTISFGYNTCLRNNVEIAALQGAHINIGNNFFSNRFCTVLARHNLAIGDNCMLACNVTIIDHDHSHTDPDKPFKEQPYIGSRINIGNNVWIGSNTFIGKGVNIGDNVIIGAGSVITKDIRSNTIIYTEIRHKIRLLHCNE
jgi:acetyltransferase-like isoleucine patch superfamily enzyme